MKTQSLLDFPSHLYSKHTSRFWEDSLTDASTIVSSSTDTPGSTDSSSEDEEIAGTEFGAEPQANNQQENEEETEQNTRADRIRREMRGAEIDLQNTVNYPRRPEIDARAVNLLSQEITVFALIESEQTLNYEPKQRTERQKLKIHQKIKEAKRDMKPLTFHDL